MPYIGNIPAEAYSQMSYQDLTGGSGTSFTLDYPVGNENEIEVFVNNVRQEPTVAYTTAGTALTMTGTIAATDDFYVVFQGKAQQTIGIPEKETDGDYNFASNTLFVDAGTNRIGVNNSAPESPLDIRRLDSGSNFIRFADSSNTLQAMVGHSAAGSLISGIAAGDLAVRVGGSGNGVVFGGYGGSRFGMIDSDGLKFNTDTAAANALDDYEEGTWTPYWGGTTSDPTVTYSEQLGSYTKIGNTVHATIRLVTSSYSGGSGDLRIKGLPFSRVSNGYESDAVVKGFVYNFSTDIDTMLVFGSTITCYSSDNNNTENAVNSVGSAAYFNASFTYRTA